MNNVNIIGRVARDIELRSIPNGTSVAELTLAVDDGFGEKKKTAWIGVVLWGKTAEIAARYVTKGDQIGITGRLTQDSWEDKETGKKREKTKVTAENLHLLGGQRRADAYEKTRDMGQEQSSQEPRRQQSQRIEDDDIPF